MFQAFIIVSREGCELLLVLLALWTALRDHERPELIRWGIGGLAAGLVLAGVTIAHLPSTGLSEWFDITLTFGFGISLALVSTGTMASLADIDSKATARLEAWLAHRAAGPAVAVFVVLSTWREVLEAFLLLRFIAAGQESEELAWGVSLGLAACVLLGLAWQRLRHGRGARWAFRLSAVILFVLGAQMMIDAVVETLLRGVGGAGSTQVARSFVPFLEEGDHYWISCLVLAIVPVAIWSRRWWRRV